MPALLLAVIVGGLDQEPEAGQIITFLFCTIL
jgi:hypothetical protein